MGGGTFLLLALHFFPSHAELYFWHTIFVYSGSNTELFYIVSVMAKGPKPHFAHFSGELKN